MSGLSEDANGNLWLTIVDGNEFNPRLLKLDVKAASPGGSSGFTEINLPYSQATIRRPIAAGGKVWVPLMDKSKILSFDPETNEFKEYATPTPNAGVGRLAVDRWDRLWFAETQANKIGMLDPRTNSIIEFSIPTPNSKTEMVAVDRESDIVYFTEGSGNKIGKLTLRP
jgi:streptogramin lyase